MMEYVYVRLCQILCFYQHFLIVTINIIVIANVSLVWGTGWTSFVPRASRVRRFHCEIRTKGLASFITLYMHAAVAKTNLYDRLTALHDNFYKTNFIG